MFLNKNYVYTSIHDKRTRKTYVRSHPEYGETDAPAGLKIQLVEEFSKTRIRCGFFRYWSSEMINMIFIHAKYTFDCIQDMEVRTRLRD